MMLFIASPAFPAAAESVHVGFHAGAVRTPADKANAGIRTAITAGEIPRRRYGVFFRRAGRSGSCFFFCFGFLAHGALLSRKTKKAPPFYKDSALIFRIRLCIDLTTTCFFP
jgi:hypothetical protein